MNILKTMANKVMDDKYFCELYNKSEKIAAHDFFKVQKNECLETKEKTNLLRFADILSHSETSAGRNMSYKVISLLADKCQDDEIFKYYANTILTTLGNFPAIKYMEDNFSTKDNLSVETALEMFVKMEYQQVPDSEDIFTDSQYKVYESLKNNNHFSFSGPTSLGKSFLFEAFIKHLIVEHRGQDNIVILVPTRALINQTVLKLKRDLEKIDNYRILAHPTVPLFYKKDNMHFIFVFTPERLLAYLAERDNPKIDYLLIDEAQKIISEKDSRSPLYYHAILQAERKSIKLYFSSPNIPNPDVFLKVFEKSTDEHLSIRDSPVSQNRYFLDLIDQRCIFLSDLGSEAPVETSVENHDFFYWLKFLGDNQKNIIYCNTTKDTVEFARHFAEDLPLKKDKRIDEVIEIIEGHLHKKYYLIECLRKGVAFHFGRLPQRIREKVESLFRDKVIDYMFCTSTLLEGVNLPAKNIFILSNAIGTSKFTSVDFWNLAGRAGRLTKELSGNIICARIEHKKNRWDNIEQDLVVIKNKDVQPIAPLVIKGQKSFYKNLENSLLNTAFTNKKASQEQKNIWNHYANISLIHEIRQDESILKANFIKSNSNAKKILEKMKKGNSVPTNVLSVSSSIKAIYQNNIFNDDKLSEHYFPKVLDYNNILSYLSILYDKYNWKEEEVGGRNPMVKSENKNKLKYYALMMEQWVNSKPLSQIIALSIRYYTQEGVIWDTDHLVPFEASSKKHINMIIDEIITTIENTLRFKLKNYFSNFHMILEEKLGEGNAGSNWAEYLEYGTTDRKIIELQNIGLPRHLAKLVIEQYSSCLDFEDDILTKFDQKILNSEMDKNTPEYKEMMEFI